MKGRRGSEYCLAVIACPSKKTAVKIKNFLLDGRLAACVNFISDVRSYFWWQGKKESTEETILLAKTTRRKFREIVVQVAKIHPYDVPEIISLPIIDGNRPYLNWVDDTLEKSRS